MRNTWLIIKREYLQRVRTRSFLVLTVLAPAIMTVLMAAPAKFASMGQKPEHVVLVTSTQQFGEVVRQQLLANPMASEDEDGGDSAKQKPEEQYIIDIDARPSDAERAALQNKIGTRDIDGYVWLTDDAISTHTVTWSGRERADSRERSWLGEVLNRILLQQQLSKTGMASNQAHLLLQPFKVDSVRIERGREVKSSGGNLAGARVSRRLPTSERQRGWFRSSGGSSSSGISCAAWDCGCSSYQAWAAFDR